MADSSILVTPGTTTPIDTRTESTNSNHRQVMVIGDPASNAGVAPVDAVAGLTVNTVPVAAGGCSGYHVVAAASTNTANIKNAAGQLYGVHAFCNAAYAVHVKFHNTSGTPTAGTGVVRTVSCQSGQRADLVFPQGIAFSTGIGISIVKLIADNDTTVLVASDCVVDVDYK
jgi:hypothetical protein